MKLKIGEYELAPGEKKQIYLPVINDTMKLPMVLINGTEEGPTVLISAGVHGAEYIGIQTAMELSRELEPGEIKGSIVFLLTANPTACKTFTRFVVPEDNKNLNRVFPGNKDGTLSEKIAYTMVRELYGNADYHIDLHAGDTSEQVMPFVYFPGGAAPEVTEKAKMMAMAADLSIRARSSSTTGAYSSSALHGVPSLLIERGGGGVYSIEEVELYKQDIRNILIHLGVLSGSEVHRLTQREVNRATYIEAEQDGFWYPALQAGDTFEEGHRLGELRDIWGNLLSEWKAEYEGIVLYQTVGMGVSQGDPLIAYGQPE